MWGDNVLLHPLDVALPQFQQRRGPSLPHSVRELRGMGIQPDIIGLRSDLPIDGDIRAKVALFCDVEREAVMPLTTADSIYEVPLMLEEAGLGNLVVGMLHLQEKTHSPDLNDWRDAIARLKAEKPTVHIALVGKYVELHDAYISVREALIHAGLHHGYAVDIDWIHSETLEHGENLERIRQANGIVVPGGFGSRGIEGKILADRP